MGAQANIKQVAVASTATAVLTRSQRYVGDRVIITNHTTTPIYIGTSSDVTSSNGTLLAGIVGYQLILSNREEIWAIAPSLTPPSTAAIGVVNEVK